MISEDYLKKLSQYVGRDIKWIIKKDEIIVQCDAEFSLIIQDNYSTYFLYSEYRGKRELISKYNYDVENDLKVSFARRLRNNFNSGIDYSHSSKFEKANNIKEVVKLLSIYCDSNFYSVDNPQRGRINLESEKEGKYSVYYMDIDGNRHYHEKCEEHSFAFARFYNEIACLSGMVEQINDYSKVFGEKIDDQRTIQRLIYGY